MASEALLPFMCYRHPNSKSSVLQLSDVICWESDEHILMVIFGLVMIGTMCLYWCFLLYITRSAPFKAKEEPERVTFRGSVHCFRALDVI